MAIRELAQIAATVAELKNKIVGAALANKLEYVNSAAGNLTVKGVLPPEAATIIGKELGVEFVQVNSVAWEASANGVTITLAEQGRTTLVMFKSY